MCCPFCSYLRSSKSAFKIFLLPAANLKQGRKVTSSLPSLPVFLSLLFFLAEHHSTSCSSSNSLTSLHPHTKQNTLPPLDYFVHLHNGNFINFIYPGIQDETLEVILGGWVTDLIVYQNFLQGMLARRLQGSSLRASDAVTDSEGLGWALKFAFLASS